MNNIIVGDVWIFFSGFLTGLIVCGLAQAWHLSKKIGK